MQCGGSAAHPPDAGDFHASRIALRGDVFLCRRAYGLGDDQGHGCPEDGHRQPTEAVAPAALPNSHQREKGHGTGEEAGRQQVGAAVGMDRKLVLPLTESVECMVGGRVQGLGRDVSVEIEAFGVRAADHRRVGEPGAQQMDGGVF